MGVLGAAGLVVWSLLFAGFLARTSGDGATRVPAAALKGALVSIGLASMMGMPAQSLPVVNHVLDVRVLVHAIGRA
jgi:hypothetical protein